LLSEENKKEETVEETHSSEKVVVEQNPAESSDIENKDLVSKEENSADEQNTSEELVSEEEVADKQSNNSSIDAPLILGKKLGMTRIFDENGQDYPATLVEAGPCFVTQIKTVENDGYSSIQLGFSKNRDKKTNKALKGHFNNANTGNLKYLKEYQNDDNSNISLGDEVNVGIFELGDMITAIGVSKGRGFTGHMKRHGFSGGRRSHGKNSVMRKAGSIGAGSDPSRVWPGTRMAGRSGNQQVSVKNLEVIRVDVEKNLIYIKGAVPGSKNSLIYLKKS